MPIHFKKNSYGHLESMLRISSATNTDIFYKTLDLVLSSGNNSSFELQMRYLVRECQGGSDGAKHPTIIEWDQQNPPKYVLIEIDGVIGAYWIDSKVGMHAEKIWLEKLV